MGGTPVALAKLALPAIVFISFTMYSLFLQALFVASTFALPVEERAVPAQIEERAAAPSATIKNGTIVGSTTNNVDSFSSIPFALPPTGSLRLKPPQSRTSAFPGGTFTATAPAKACPQFAFQVDGTDLPNDIPSDVLGELLNTPLFQKALNEDEDCLQINVQRPAGTSKDAKLPVLFWIYGGGFEAGWASMFDGSKIIQKSVDLGQPIMYVSVGYRVGGFGFLAGDDLAKEGSTNLGLRDQRLGLQWVQDNIAGFALRHGKLEQHLPAIQTPGSHSRRHYLHPDPAILPRPDHLAGHPGLELPCPVSTGNTRPRDLPRVRSSFCRLRHLRSKPPIYHDSNLLYQLCEQPESQCDLDGGAASQLATVDQQFGQPAAVEPASFEEYFDSRQLQIGGLQLPDAVGRCGSSANMMGKS